MDLPHRFPFCFVDAATHGVVRIRLAAGGRFLGDRGELPQTLALEALAQACFYLVPRGAEPQEQLSLAGIEDARFGRLAQAGEELAASAELVARFGALVRVRGRLEASGDLITEADLLLSAG